MAVITFDLDSNTVSALVEKTDRICNKKGSTTEICGAHTYSAGKVFVNGEIGLCMIRGERQ